MARSDHTERQSRILDAAAELFVHYGYDKTTVSDIAREAGVSKGAIYLHFESKDDLFEQLLYREMTAYSMTWIGLLEADPRGGTIGGMYKNMLYALDRSPFMAALFSRDRRFFGTYLRKPDTFLKDPRLQSNRRIFVEKMQEAGAIRQDLDAGVVAHIMNMLSYGLVAASDVIPDDQIPPTEDIIEGIADLMDRALTPEGGGDSEAGKAIVRGIFEASRRVLEDDDAPPE